MDAFGKYGVFGLGRSSRFFKLYEGDSGGGSGSGGESKSGESKEGEGKGEEQNKSKEKPKEEERSGGFEPITSQEALDAVVTRRLDRFLRTETNSIRDAVRAEIEEEIREEEAKKQGDFESLYKKAKAKLDDYEAKEREADELELKRKVALDVGFDKDKVESVLSRFDGKDEAELKKDAKALLELIGPSKEAPDDTDLGKSGQGGNTPPKPDADYEKMKEPSYWISHRR